MLRNEFVLIFHFNSVKNALKRNLKEVNETTATKCISFPTAVPYYPPVVRSSFLLLPVIQFETMIKYLPSRRKHV